MSKRGRVRIPPQKAADFLENESLRYQLIGSEKIWDRGAALTSRLQTFETEILAEEENIAGLARLNRELIERVEGLGSSGSKRVYAVSCRRTKS
jgi:hypothetical protein